MGIETDLRCPANKPMGQLACEVLDLLKEQYHNKLFTARAIKFQFNGVEIAENQTFESVGAWDGSYIHVL